jgi:hypothetical protein
LTIGLGGRQGSPQAGRAASQLLTFLKREADRDEASVVIGAPPLSERPAGPRVGAPVSIVASPPP